jgi:hypothetical protein
MCDGMGHLPTSRHNSGETRLLNLWRLPFGRHVEAGRMVACSPHQVLLLQEWESRAHCERWIAWRVETGQHDGFLEFLAPVLTAPLELRFRELDPE